MPRTIVQSNRWCRALISVVLAATPALVLAQEASEPAAAAPPATAVAVAVAPEPIPAAVIVARGVETAALLERVDALIEPDPEIAALAEQLQADRETLAGYRRELDGFDRLTVSKRTLTDQRDRWNRAGDSLNSALDTLRTRWQSLLELRDEVRFEQSAWTLTRDSLTETGLGPEVLASIGDMIARIDDTLARLGPRIDAISELMNRAARRVAAVEEALDELDELAVGIRQRLFRRDAPALWNAPALGPSTLLAESRRAADYWWRTAVDWGRGHASQLLIFVLAFLGFLALMLTTGRARSAWPDDRSLDRAAFIVSRPVATAALGALAVAVFVFDPITGPVRDLFRVIVLVAVIRLGPGLSAPLPRAVFRGVVGLYFAATLYGLTPDGALLGRVLVVLMAVGATAVGYRAWRTWPVKERWMWRVGQSGCAVAAGLALLGGTASALGWVDLGSTAVNGVINTALATVAWLLVVRSVAGLLPLLQTGFVGDNLSSIRRRRQQFERAILVPVTLAALYGWTTGVLNNFSALEPVRQGLATLLALSLRIGGLQISLGGVLGAVAILVATTFIARVVRFILSEEVFPRLQMRPGTVSTLVSLINYLIITIGVMMGATAAGFNATQLTVVLGAMSVGIGFGLQAVVGNFVSGLILMFERPVSVGDQVEAGGFLGRITHIGIRASRVRTFDGSDVIIPNSDLVTRQVVNWTLKDGIKRIQLDFAVGLESNPRTVLDTLTAAAAAHELVLEEPAPRALMRGYGECSIDFRLQAWVRVENAITVSSDLHLTLIEQLRGAGIEVPAVPRERHDPGPHP